MKNQNIKNNKKQIKTVGASIPAQQKKNTQNGITLIALILTIIILLILATVSISLVINNNVLDNAQYGVEKYSEEEEFEQVKLAVAAAMLKGNGFLDKDNLNSELQVIFPNDKTVTGDETSDYFIYEVSKKYKINKDGKVEEILSGLPYGYKQVEYLEGLDGVNRPRIEVTNEKGINSKKLYVEAQVVYIPKGNSNNANRSILFTAGEYGKCFTAFYRQASQYVAIYSGSAQIFPARGYSDIIENEIATINSNYAKVGNIEIPINNTSNAESIYNTFIVAAGIGKFGYVNIYEVGEDNENIIRHELIPCVDENNEPCMYDKITSKTFYNKGVGEYIPGPEV